MTNKKFKILYRPNGRAGEYADHGYALNLYHGCLHECQYCYVPSIRRQTPQAFHESVTPQKDVLKRLEHDVALGVLEEPIFMCFSCDCYPPGDVSELTRDAIKIILNSGNRVNILTKAGLRAARDFDLLGCFPGNKIGATITFNNNDDSIKWEPGAASPSGRVELIRLAKMYGMFTWISMEPVIVPAQTLDMIDRTAGIVDEYRIGKWNHDPRAKEINWPKFRDDAINLLEKSGQKYKIKKDLQEAR